MIKSDAAPRSLAGRLEASLDSPLAAWLVVLASVLLALGLVYPHVGEAIWQDEAATLTFHASRGVVDPFLHYVSPNSHIGFTSLLAAWMKLFPDGLDVFKLRLLPLLMFLAAIPVTFAAARRMGGTLCGVLAALFFATSAVSENFATQLRGYGPSWIFFAVALLAALNILEAGVRGKVARLGYFLSCLLAIAVLPTNLFYLMVLGIAVSIRTVLEPNLARSEKRETLLILLAAPVLGLLAAYSAVWKEFMGFAGVDFSAWTRADLVGEWLRGSLANIVWIVPLVGAGLAGLFFALARQEWKGSDEVRAVTLSALLVVGFLAAVAVIPNPPFPRTLVPYLPVWLAAIAHLTIAGIRGLASRASRLHTAVGAAVTVGLILLSPIGESCRGSKGNGEKFHYDLCHQYFRDGYAPERVLDVWASLPANYPIVSDFEGYHALRILGSPARVHEYRNVRPAQVGAPLIVAHSQGELETMASALGLDPRQYVLAEDTGYFNVYRPSGLP